MLANAARFFPTLTGAAVYSDITRVDPSEMLSRIGMGVEEAALVHGGPPCTPFSKSGYWLEYKRAGVDPRASLLDNYAGVIEATLPAALLLENVYGLAYRGRGRPILERFLDRVRQHYAVDFRVLLAADYGVPQLRQRLFCVGIRTDLLDCHPEDWAFHWPAETHSGPHETRRGRDQALPPHVTSAEALADLPSSANPPEVEEAITGTYAEALRGVPAGENYLFWTTERGHPEPRFKWRSRYWNFLLKLDPNRPSPTIQGQPGPWVGPFHWDNRRLRVVEVKRLMTFPDDFAVLGSRREQQLQLGNAVPPAFAECVAASIANELGRVGFTSRRPAAA